MDETISLEKQLLHKQRVHTRFVMYILSFLFTLHYALPVYINSSFLNLFTSEKYVGIIYIVASILAILVFFSIPRILQKHGNYRTICVLLTVEIISLLGLAFSKNVLLIVPAFIASFIAVALINFNMDIFLENFSSSKNMGKARGFFLTSSNSAWIVAALLTSFILTDGDYWKIYLSAAVLIVPVFFLLSSNLKDFKDPVYAEVPVIKTLKEIWANKNIFDSFMVSFLLQFFYAWMTIYTPIYLHEHLLFSWQQIGIMFSIMLLPFVITELPLGKLADNRFGEKEIMSIGFIIIAISTGIVSFIQGNNFFLWTAILVITRIGASMIEIMSETYFFKKVDGSRANLISFFRTLRPLAYIISPALAIILFSIPGFQFQYIFVILAIIMFFGLRYSLSLEDTR